MKSEFILEKLEKYGELHLVVDEHDAISGDEEYIGLRNSENVEISDGYIEINDGRKPHWIDLESVIYVTPAQEFPD